MDLQWIYWYILHSPDIFSIIMVQIDPPARVHLFGASLSFISMSDELADFYFFHFFHFFFCFPFVSALLGRESTTAIALDVAAVN